MSFYILAGILLVSAVLTVTLRNLFHCALFLISALLALAGIYFSLGAPVVGVMQLVIYVGAIMVLILFAIMLTSRISDKLVNASNEQILPSILAIAAFLFFTITAILQTKFPKNIGVRFDPIIDLSRDIMTTYLLPFEVISVVLLAAIVGAIAMARPEPNGSGQGKD